MHLNEHYSEEFIGRRHYLQPKVLEDPGMSLSDTCPCVNILNVTFFLMILDGISLLSGTSFTFCQAVFSDFHFSRTGPVMSDALQRSTHTSAGGHTTVSVREAKPHLCALKRRTTSDRSNIATFSRFQIK